MTTGEVNDPFKATEAIRVWTEKRNQHITFILTQESPRNQIIASVDDQYISNLHNDVTEYTTVTPKELLDHLWKHMKIRTKPIEKTNKE